MNLIKRLGITATAGTALALSSCSTGGNSPSGFLSNYKQMDGGYGTANAVSAYVKPGADLKKYDSVIIDPVTTIIASPGIDAKVADQVAAYLSDALRAQIQGELKIVTVPGPSTLRIRTALTDVVENEEHATPVTVVHAAPRATLTGALGSPEVAAFIAKVAFEGEIVDSVGGNRLLASVDQRLGSKRDVSAMTPWNEVRTKVKQGVGRLNQRFLTLRGN